MDSMIQVVLTGNATELVDATGVASDSLDTLGASAQRASGMVAESSVATDDAAAAYTTAGERAGASSAGYVEAGSAAEASGAAAAEGSTGFDLFGGAIAKVLLPLAALFGIYEGGKAILSDTIKNTELYQSDQAVLTNTLKQTNDAVGLSVDQLDKLAEANSKNSAVSEVANLNAENILLSYNEIGKSTFPQAASAVDNLATKMALLKGNAVPSLQQTDLAAKMLGKALEDPAAGMTAFTRAGLSFNATQIASVKALEETTVGAQNQIKAINGLNQAAVPYLANWGNLTAAQQKAYTTTYNLTAAQIAQAVAIDKTTGIGAAQVKLLNDLAPATGAAAAEATTLGGKIAIMKNQMESWEVGVGNSVTNDLLPKLAKGANEAADAIITELAPSFDRLTGVISKSQPILTVLERVFKVVGEVIGAEVVMAIKGAIDVFTVLFEVLDKVAEYFEKNRTAMIGLEIAVAALLIGMTPLWAALLIGVGLIDKFHKQLQPVINILVDIFKPALTSLGQAIMQNLVPAIDRMFRSLSPQLVEALKIVALVVAGILVGALWLLINVIKIAVDGLSVFIDIVSDATNWAKAMAGVMWNLGAAIEGGVYRAVALAVHALGGLPQALIDVTAGFPVLLINAGASLIEGLVKGIENSGGNVGKALSNVASGAVKDLKNVLGIHSPSTVFAEIGQNMGQGMVQGISGTQSAVGAATSSLATAAVSGATSRVIPSNSSVTSSTPPVTGANTGSVVVNIASVNLSTAAAVQAFLSMNRDQILASKGMSLTQGTVPA